LVISPTLFREEKVGWFCWVSKEESANIRQKPSSQPPPPPKIFSPQISIGIFTSFLQMSASFEVWRNLLLLAPSIIFPKLLLLFNAQNQSLLFGINHFPLILPHFFFLFIQFAFFSIIFKQILCEPKKREAKRNFCHLNEPEERKGG
jgi:hypothetical protein